jgi:S-DNA-T family DNA segregation ATPase FtsK/SpoIIIE
VAAAIAAELTKRLPPDNVTAAQLRGRSWWTGPEIFVLVDDYDLLATGASATPLTPLLPFLAQARDIGFHLVLARRSGGAGRAMHEPLILRMRESGATALLLSGDRQEGALFPGAVMCTQPPGRGILVRHGRHPTVVQVGFRGDEPIRAGRVDAVVGSIDG